MISKHDELCKESDNFLLVGFEKCVKVYAKEKEIENYETSYHCIRIIHGLHPAICTFIRKREQSSCLFL